VGTTEEFRNMVQSEALAIQQGPSRIPIQSRLLSRNRGEFQGTSGSPKLVIVNGVQYRVHSLERRQA
jgi:hypothetical protein